MSDETTVSIPKDAIAIVVKADGDPVIYIPEDNTGDMTPLQALLFSSILFFDRFPDHPIITEIFAWMDKDMSLTEETPKGLDF